MSFNHAGDHLRTLGGLTGDNASYDESFDFKGYGVSDIDWLFVGTLEFFNEFFNLGGKFFKFGKSKRR